MLNITQYTTKSIVLRGETADATRKRREEIKKLGGLYNAHLRSGQGDGKEPGWIFPMRNKDKIQAYVDQINQEIIQNQDMIKFNKRPPKIHPQKDEDTHNGRIDKSRLYLSSNIVFFEYTCSCIIITVCILLTVYSHLSLMNACPHGKCVVEYCEV